MSYLINKCPNTLDCVLGHFGNNGGTLVSARHEQRAYSTTTLVAEYDCELVFHV